MGVDVHRHRRRCHDVEGRRRVADGRAVSTKLLQRPTNSGRTRRDGRHLGRRDWRLPDVERPHGAMCAAWGWRFPDHTNVTASLDTRRTSRRPSEGSTSTTSYQRAIEQRAGQPVPLVVGNTATWEAWPRHTAREETWKRP